MTALILAERRLHRTWGPKKLHKVLEVKHGIESPPARSTIGEILRRHGLSERRRRKPGMYTALTLFLKTLYRAAGWPRNRLH